jgi:hypothetical protein
VGGSHLQQKNIFIRTHTLDAFSDIRARYAAECLAIVKTALIGTGYNKAHAAKILGVKRTTLVQFLKRHAPGLLLEPYQGKTEREMLQNETSQGKLPLSIKKEERSE